MIPMTYTEATEYIRRRLVALEAERAALRSALRALEVAKAAPQPMTTGVYTSTEVLYELPADEANAIAVQEWERKAIGVIGLPQSAFIAIRTKLVLDGRALKTPAGLYYRRSTT